MSAIERCMTHEENLDRLLSVASKGDLEQARAQLPDLATGPQQCGCAPYARGFILFNEGNWEACIEQFRIAERAQFSRDWCRYFTMLAEANRGELIESFQVACALLMSENIQFAMFYKDLAEHYFIVTQLLLRAGETPSSLEQRIKREIPERFFVDSLGAQFNTGLLSHFLLNNSVARFTPVATKRILVTSVRKSGTHAVSAVCQHLIGADRNHAPFIDGLLSDDEFTTLIQGDKLLFTGHVPRTTRIDQIFADAFVILCTRDPVSQAVSMSHHLQSPESYDPAAAAVKARPGAERALHYALFGYDDGIYRLSSIYDEYKNIALAWWNRADMIIKFEDLHKIRRGEARVEEIFKDIENAFDGRGPPDDLWERVTAGLAPEISASYVSHVRPVVQPDWLPGMVECLAPGLRRVMGYP
jgi:hypothetical protein